MSGVTDEQFLAPAVQPEEDELDRSLRPRALDEFVGQERVKEQLAIALEATRARGEALDHLLLIGPPGLGKTSLAFIVREELGVGLRSAAGPGARAQGRRGRDPDRARRARRPLHRRDPPAQPRGRGDPLPGARGLPARHRRRPGPRGADADARPAAVHADRRDHAHRPADDAAARPLRDDLPARALRARRAGADRAPLGADPRRRDRGRGRRRDRRGARAARRGSRTASCGACATSPRCATRARSRPRSRARRSSCSRWTSAGSSAPTARCCARSSRSSTAARSGCPRWPSRSARSRTRSRTSTSRTCSSSASSSARRAGGS